MILSILVFGLIMNILIAVVFCQGNILINIIFTLGMLSVLVGQIKTTMAEKKEINN
ncbi:MULTISPECIES: hypothetical protein [Vagococcus]|uniref:Uncharacterized protein n=1 Tax=Vagococcus fluvialis bH819 TaxID=1255619 RepID=A0A1X6WLR9_9ENTE|nr:MULTISPECIES: hypothetical protein [Vagococcus]SLM85283.1 hypothetical protein FM121_04245 [Vagococcus fluvialis bH819]